MWSGAHVSDKILITGGVQAEAPLSGILKRGFPVRKDDQVTSLSVKDANLPFLVCKRGLQARMSTFPGSLEDRSGHVTQFWPMRC